MENKMTNLTKKEPTVAVPVSVLSALFYEHDCWAGSMHPDDREEFLSRYPETRKKLAQLSPSIDKENV